jgi:hypothetical protein
VLRELSRHPDVLRRETSASQSVPDAVAEFADEGVDVLILNGGDGTVHRALTEILAGSYNGWRPMLAPTRCGRTNMIALDLGTGRNPAASVRRVIEAARAGNLEERVLERHAIGAEISGQLEYGMFFGVGVLYRAIQLTHRSFPEGRAQGVFGGAVMAATLITRLLAGDSSGVLDPDKIQISLDREVISSDEFQLVLATTLNRLILGLNPFFGSGPGPLRVSALAKDSHRLSRALPGLLRGSPPRWATPEEGYTSRNVREAAFQLDCGIAFDGEMFAPEPGRVLRVHTSEPLRFVRA